MANVMWILSLILSLCCALLTTSMQQSARVYLDYAQHRGAPRKQARIREYMFEGAEKFRVSQAVGTMPFLLHISVFLFFAGLFYFLLPINTVVAFSALGIVVVCAFVYALLTLLPILRPNCPYRTALSGFTYFSFHFAASSLFWAAGTIEGIFHGLLLEIWRWFHPVGSPNHGPTKWRAVLEEKVRMHYKRFWHGLQGRVVLGAMEAPSSVDANALYWTLTTLNENKKFEEFAASMPGFFDSGAHPDATSAMLSLMSEQPTSDPILGSRLHQLLNTCLPGASLLTEEQRKSRLRVCLKSLWYCLRAFNLPENSGKPLVPYVSAIFASPQVIRWYRSETDLAVRLLGRCFGSLVVKKLANDINSRRTLTGDPPTTAEMACLSSILTATGERVSRWLDQKGAVALENVTFLASGELETLVDTGFKGVPVDVVDVFQQTLDILANGMFSSQADIEWDTDQVAHFHKIYSKFAKAPVPDVLKEPLEYISDRLPSPPTGESEMVTPFPGRSRRTWTPAHIRIPRNPVRITGKPPPGPYSNYAGGADDMTPISALLPRGISNFR